MAIKNNFKINFGPYIRDLRIKNGFGQRELASKIGIAASYLNDIEKNKRSAPKAIVLKKLSKLLKINIDDLNDLAGLSKKSLAPDIIEFIEKNNKIISLIRSIKDNELSEEESYIIQRRFLQHPRETYDVIAKSMRVSRQYIRTREAYALKKIKAKLLVRFGLKREDFFE